jgi:RHS repeat-associated protein
VQRRRDDNDSVTNVVTEYAYDARHNRTKAIAPDPSATATGTGLITTRSAYDSSDRLCRVVENSTQTDGQWAALADPCTTAISGTTTTNLSTRYAYDGNGNLTSMIDALGQTTTYAYDERGQAISTTDALGKTTVWTYDDLGHRINQSNPTESPLNSVVWTYDGAGRVLTRVAGGVTTTYAYDASGNQLTASDGTFTINSTYDRLNRVLAVDDEDAGTTPDTTYTYALTSPSWTDPTGSYSATLDKFDRATAVNDPADATDFTTTYGADGQPLTTTDPNGNATALTYDRLGRLTGKNTTAAGPVNRALYTWGYNRAGQVLSEASTITGDPANGQVDYTYDPLARLTSSALSGTTTSFAWDKVPNRTAVQIGAGTPATTAFSAANRPLSGANPAASYTTDDDGHLTARPGQTLTWDDLGRLKQVKNTGGTVLATYTYDPLDRLRMVDYGAGVRTRFRYVGLTTSAAQLIDDAAGTVTRNIGNGWTGERLLDWTGTNSNIRIYGTNTHHDVTWLASSTGTVSQSLRYDPWGVPRLTAPVGYTPFQFQGSFYDAVTDLSWVVTRWYAPALGTFISEDSLLGQPRDPDSRHLYAYGEGDPVGRIDTNGQFWHRVRPSETLASVAGRYLGASKLWPAIWNANRPSLPSNPSMSAALPTGSCLYVPIGWFVSFWDRFSRNRPNDPCLRRPASSYSDTLRGFDWTWLRDAQVMTGVGDGRMFFDFTRQQLYAKTAETSGHRPRVLSLSTWVAIRSRVAGANSLARALIDGGATVYQEPFLRGVHIVDIGAPPWCGPHPCTLGDYIFLNRQPRTGDGYKWLLSHEYIHVLQFEGRGGIFGAAYFAWLFNPLHFADAGPNHAEEAPAYLWQAWIQNFQRYGEPYPWTVWRRPLAAFH